MVALLQAGVQYIEWGNLPVLVLLVLTYIEWGNLPVLVLLVLT